MADAQVHSTDAPKRYMVTGGAGFLGINLIRYLLARGHQVTSLDVSLSFSYSNLAVPNQFSYQNPSILN